LPVAAPLIAGGLTAAATMTHGDMPKLRVGIAAVAGAVILGAIAGAVPQLARVFAYLIILGALLGPGYDLVLALTKLIT
jgi:hypothetical protein